METKQERLLLRRWRLKQEASQLQASNRSGTESAHGWPTATWAHAESLSAQEGLEQAQPLQKEQLRGSPGPSRGRRKCQGTASPLEKPGVARLSTAAASEQQQFVSRPAVHCARCEAARRLTKAAQEVWVRSGEVRCQERTLCVHSVAAARCNAARASTTLCRVAPWRGAMAEPVSSPKTQRSGDPLPAAASCHFALRETSADGICLLRIQGPLVRRGTHQPWQRCAQRLASGCGASVLGRGPFALSEQVGSAQTLTTAL